MCLLAWRVTYHHTSHPPIIIYCRFLFVMHFSPMPYFLLSHLFSSVLVASFRHCRLYHPPISLLLCYFLPVSSVLCLLLSRLSPSLFVAPLFCLSICLLHVFLYCRFSPRPIFIVSLLCLYRRLCPRPICRLLNSPNLFPLPRVYLLPPFSAMFVASLLLLVCRSLSTDTVVQSQKAVSDYFISKQILHFGFA